MKKSLRILFILLVAAGIGVTVARLNEQRHEFLAMSEQEQRALLAEKIGSKVPEDKLEEIQNTIITAVNGRRAS